MYFLASPLHLVHLCVRTVCLCHTHLKDRDGVRMTQLEEISIFLGSPGDVSRERKYVQTVVDELNQTVAYSMGLHIRVTSSNNAFPGYGKDAQSVINEQIAQMSKYDLFIGIMWKRIGTPTARAKSGTVEELSRAVRSFNRRKKPEIWFYFRTSPVSFKTKKEIEQAGEVLEFKNRFKKRSLFREYDSSAAFPAMLRKHLCLWLNTRKSQGSKSSSSSLSRSPKNSTGRQKNQMKTTLPSFSSNINKKTKEITTKVVKQETLARTKSSGSPPKRSTSRTANPISSPGSWIMLDYFFFSAKSSAVLSDKRISLKVTTKDLEEVAQLKRLHTSNGYHRGVVSFANSHEAGLMRVSSMTIESESGASTFDIMLEAGQSSQANGIGLEMNYSNYTAEQAAELRIRLMLLGEALPKEIGRFASTRVNKIGGDIVIDNEIFSDLWQKLHVRSSSQFLPRAWLWAAYNLKMSQIIDDILELELGPMKNKTMPIRFRGTRKSYYHDTEKKIISVTGNCKISA